MIWWLSVDNFFVSDLSSPDIFSAAGFRHAYQSHYAKDFLEKKGLDSIFPLFDYISIPISTPPQKKDVVCYNPKKGFEVTEKIIEKLGNCFMFRALEKMTGAEISSTLAESKIYIDFGAHPGKDRIPREAVLNDNIVLTSRKGAAAFFDDVPIGDTYKFDCSDIDGICSKINDAMERHGAMLSDFKRYADSIRGQKDEFFSQVQAMGEWL